MIKAILYERTVAVCVSMNSRKGLVRSELWGNSQWSRCRKESMKTRMRIQNISKAGLQSLHTAVMTCDTLVNTRTSD